MGVYTSNSSGILTCFVVVATIVSWSRWDVRHLEAPPAASNKSSRTKLRANSSSSKSSLNDQLLMNISQIDGESERHTISTRPPQSNYDPRPRGLRLVMIGDSIMRYQYLSLAYFLRKGTWWNEERMKPYHLVDETSFESFPNFFNVTSTKILAPFERCDCHRPQWCDLYAFIDLVTENRYFYEPLSDNSLTYIGAMGHYATLHGRFSPQEALHNITEFQYNHDSFSESQLQWSTKDWDWVIREHVAKLVPKPTHVVLNAGIWDNKFGKETLRQRLVQALEETNMTGIWRTTSYHADHGPYTAETRTVLARDSIGQDWYQIFIKGKCDEDDRGAVLNASKLKRKEIYDPVSGIAANKLDPIMCKLLGACLDVTWSNCIESKFYFDRMHFYEPIYRIFNEELLEMLGWTPVPQYEKKDREPYMKRNQSDCWVKSKSGTSNA